MTTKKKNEIETLVEVNQEIVLDGKAYQMRRLNVRDVFSFANLFWKAMAQVREELGEEALEQQDDAAATNVFFEAFLGNPVGFAKVFGPVIGMTPDEFMRMSPKATMDFLGALQKQEDLNAFFGAALAMMGTLGSLSRGQ